MLDKRVKARLQKKGKKMYGIFNLTPVNSHLGTGWLKLANNVF